jgi:hypothetical protein
LPGREATDDRGVPGDYHEDVGGVNHAVTSAQVVTIN